MYSRLLLLFLALSSPFLVMGQEDSVTQFEQTYELGVSLDTARREYDKVNLPPRKEQQVTPQTFQLKSYNLPLSPLDPSYRVYGIKPDKKPALWGNYVRAGFGNYTTPYAEGHFNSKRNKDMAWGVYARHLSSLRGPVRKKDSRESETNLELYGKSFQRNAEWTGSIGYDRWGGRYYGVYELPISDSLFPSEPEKIVYNLFRADVGVKNLNPKSSIDYDGNLGLHFINNSFENQEFEVALGARPVYALNGNDSLGLDIQTFFGQYSEGDGISRIQVGATPYYDFVFDGFDIRAGANLTYENDTIGDKNDFHVFPVLQVDFTINQPHDLHVFAGLTGGVDHVNYRQLAWENHFLDTNISLFNSTRKWDVYGGVRGGFAKHFAFELRAGVQNYDNLYFFVNDSLNPEKFDVEYETDRAILGRISGELMYMRKAFELGLKGEYVGYNLKTLSEAYHRPNFTASLYGGYKIKDKVLLNTEIYYLSGLYGRDFDGVDTKLDGIIDINLAIDYRWNNRLSIFWQLNNIASQKYQRYLYYPNKGINTLVGLTYSF